MSQSELLKQVVHALNGIGIQYMITGSVVSSMQGEPRSTHDIDLVIAIQNSQAQKLVEAFPPPDFYLDKESIINAIAREKMFNLIEVNSGDKVDFWMLTDDPFDRSRFSRKIREDFMGITMEVSAPEDTILAKLKWAKLSGGSEKQFTDSLRVFEVQYEKLDLRYLENWARKLEVESYWLRLKTEAITT